MSPNRFDSHDQSTSISRPYPKSPEHFSTGIPATQLPSPYSMTSRSLLADGSCRPLSSPSSDTTTPQHSSASSDCGRSQNSSTNMWPRGDGHHIRASRYRCDWPSCQYTSQLPKAVRKHRLTHQKPKDEDCYRCLHHGCGKLFVRKDNRNRHSRRCKWPSFSCVIHSHT